MDDLNDYLYFAQVVEHGGFSAAGRALGLPKSRLSRRIAMLEDRLGVRLLHRTTRRMRLTDVGEEFYGHCQTMLAGAHAARDAVDRARSEPRGALRVSCPVVTAQHRLGPILPGFLAAFPNVRLWLEVTNRPVHVVEEGYDVAIRVRPRMEDSSLVFRSFAHEQVALVASPDFLRQHGRPRDASQLSRYATIDLPRQDGRHTWTLDDPGGRPHHVVHYPRFIADDLEVLLQAVRAGAGISLLPAYLCKTDISRGDLETVLPDWQCPRMHLHAVFPSRKGILPTVRAFLDYLSEHLG